MTKTRTLTEAFRNEWQLYCEDYPTSGPVYRVEMAGDLVPFGDEPDGSEIRLLADVEPHLCVFLSGRSEDGWDVIPLSPFRNPATSGEALVGRHVYQIWNRQTISAERVARSWKVALVDAEECRDLQAVVDHVEKGVELPDHLKPAMGEAIRSEKDERLRYLSDFSVEVAEMKFKCVQVAADGPSRGPVRFRWPSRLVRSRYQKAVENHEFPLAAAVGAGVRTVALFMTGLPKSSAQFREKAFDCELTSQFLSLQPDDDQRMPLVYTWEEATPESWTRGPMNVAAYIERTGALFGRGTVDVANRRIVVDDFRGIELKTPVEKVSDIVLVVAPSGESAE